jgi:hypothetical protein
LTIDDFDYTRFDPGSLALSNLTLTWIVAIVAAIVWLCQTVAEFLILCKPKEQYDKKILTFICQGFILLSRALMIPAIETFFDEPLPTYFMDYRARKILPFGSFYVLVWIVSIGFPLAYTIVFSGLGYWYKTKQYPYVFRLFLSDVFCATSELCSDYKNRFVLWPIIGIVSEIVYAICAALGYNVANIIVNGGMIVLLYVFRPYLFGSSLILDSGVRFLQMVGDAYALYYGDPTHNPPSLAFAWLMFAIAFVPMILSLIWFLNFEMSFKQRLRAINNSLFIELDKKSLKKAGIDPKKFKKMELNDNADELTALGGHGKTHTIDIPEDDKPSEAEDDNQNGNDHAKPFPVRILPPDESVRPEMLGEIPSDEFSSIDDISEVSIDPIQARRENIDMEAKLEERLILPRCTQGNKGYPQPPLPPLPLAYPPSKVKEEREIGFARMNRIRKVLAVAAQLNAKFKDTNNGKVGYDVDLIKRFRESREAQDLKRENDSFAHDMGFICFGAIFFIGAFAYDWAAALVFVDHHLIRVWPQ